MEYQTFDRYEYKIINIGTYNFKFEKEFNKLGKDGWELVTNFNNMFIFKRKLDCIITD